MPVRMPGPDHEHAVVEVALGHGRPLRRELRDRRRDDGGVEVGEADAAQLEQRAQPGAELVGGRLADGREAPVLEQVVAVEGPEVGLGVADVDDQQHRPRVYARPMALKLFVVHGSHPCATVQRALELKGIEHGVVELPPPLHAPIQRVLFGARTVPGVRFDDGEKLSGSRAILARLDELAPEPPLLPSDPEARAEVLRAEEWGDEVLQPIARRLLWPALSRRPEAPGRLLRGVAAAGARAAAAADGAVATRAEMRLNKATEGAVRADLRALPDHLDRVDGWIASGVLGAQAAEPRRPADRPDRAAADDDRRRAPAHRGPPRGRATRWRSSPHLAGELPAGVYPADWLPAGRPAAPAGAGREGRRRERRRRIAGVRQQRRADGHVPRRGAQRDAGAREAAHELHEARVVLEGELEAPGDRAGRRRARHRGRVRGRRARRRRRAAARPARRGRGRRGCGRGTGDDGRPGRGRVAGHDGPAERRVAFDAPHDARDRRAVPLLERQPPRDERRGASRGDPAAQSGACAAARGTSGRRSARRATPPRRARAARASAGPRLPAAAAAVRAAPRRHAGAGEAVHEPLKLATSVVASTTRPTA
jgi:glutathione S-transferase